ncbi:MAG: GNAT family N-acetyltransferase [Devosiaceae bacterium]|nr:GNAT family N-acetyltransferase [Devosiaceae bacterium]
MNNPRLLVANEIEAASALFAKSFADDVGLLDILGGDKPVRPKSMQGWFRAVLKLVHMKPDNLIGLFDGDTLTGVIVLGGGKPPAAMAQLKWLIASISSAGFLQAFRTIAHDNMRRKRIRAENVNIIEFVAVARSARGQGAATKLFDVAHKQGGKFWLETVRVENLQIFERLGYHETGRHGERGVLYYIMEKSVSDKNRVF